MALGSEIRNPRKKLFRILDPGVKKAPDLDPQHCSIVFFLAFTLGTSDLDAQMSGIKFWKDDENPRPVYKKNLFTKYWAVACILDNEV